MSVCSHFLNDPTADSGRQTSFRSNGACLCRACCSIAHRLNFIRASDKILVLNTGGTINVRCADQPPPLHSLARHSQLRTFTRLSMHASALVRVVCACVRAHVCILQAFDTPENLMKDTAGYFAKQMAEENSGML